MRHRVRLSAKAMRDVEDVFRWLTEQGAGQATDRWFASLWKTLDTLESLPLRCPRAPEADALGADLRELRLGRRGGRYRLLFTVIGRDVHVLHVRHVARDGASADDL